MSSRRWATWSSNAESVADRAYNERVALTASQRRHLAGIRRLIASRDDALLAQAVTLLDSLDDPKLWASFAQRLPVRPGLCGPPELRIGPGERRGRCRTTMALHAARRAGLLDETPALRLFRMHLTDLTALTALPRLEHLSLTCCDALTSLRGLARLPALRRLDIDACPAVTDLSGLAHLPALHTLTLRSCHALSDVSGVAALTGLRSVEVTRCSGLSDLSPLSALTAVKLTVS